MVMMALLATLMVDDGTAVLCGDGDVTATPPALTVPVLPFVTVAAALMGLLLQEQAGWAACSAKTECLMTAALQQHRASESRLSAMADESSSGVMDRSEPGAAGSSDDALDATRLDTGEETTSTTSKKSVGKELEMQLQCWARSWLCR